MTFVNFKSITCALAACSTSLLINIATPTSAQATGTQHILTCAALAAGSQTFAAGSYRVSVTMAVGDTLTTTFSLVGATKNVQATKASAIETEGDPASGDLTISCTPAKEDEEAKDVQNNFTGTQAVTQLSSLYDRMSRNTQGVLNGESQSTAAAGQFYLNSASGEKATELNVWSSGDYNYFSGTDLKGYSANLVAGIDYKINPNTLFGGLVGLGQTDFDTLISSTSGKLKARALTGGIYTGHKADNGLGFDALLAYTQTKYDIVNGTATANFNSSRIGFSAGIYNSFDFNGMTIEPRARFIIARENQAAYTDSLSNAVAARTITAGRASFGPKVYFQGKKAQFTPWFSVDVEYDFSNSAAGTSSSASFNKTFSARPAFGFDYKIDASSSIYMDANAGGLGSGAYSSYGGAVTYKRKF